MGHYSPVFNDDEDSILNLCTSFEVGAVPVFDCPGFDFLYFAQQGGAELKRLKDFMGNASYFPIIGYVSDCPPVRADKMPYSIFEHDIRAVYMRWRLGVEHADSANHLNHLHLLMFLKRWHEQVLHDRPKATQDMIQMYRQLHDACTTLPVLSMRRAKAVVSFVKNMHASALMMLGSSGANIEVLSHRVIDKPWKSAMLPDGVVCKLMDGLARLRMQDRYFDKIFDAYKAKGDATGEQASAIVRFERELSGGVGPFSEEGVASGNPCSAFALFSECRASDIVDGSEGDDTLGDQWDGLSLEVKEIYVEVARNIVVGEQLSDLKTRVEAKCTEQAAQRAPPQEEQQAESTALPLFLYLSDSL